MSLLKMCSQIQYSAVFSHIVLCMYDVKFQTIGSGSLFLFLLLAVLKEKWCHCTYMHIILTFIWMIDNNSASLLVFYVVHVVSRPVGAKRKEN